MTDVRRLRALVFALVAIIFLGVMSVLTSEVANAQVGVGRTIGGKWQGGPCPDVLVIGARGSGEAPQSNTAVDAAAYAADSSNGMGDINYDVYRNLKAFAPQLHIAYEGVQYAGEPVPDLTGPSLLRTFKGYAANIKSGAAWTAQEIGLVDTSCQHHTKFVLTGYSQGAWVVHKTLNQLNASRRALLVGVTMFGDPLYKIDSIINRVNKKTNLLGGIAYLADTANVSLPSDVQKVTGDYCNTLDGVCQAGIPYLDHFSYKTNGLTKKAAAFVQQFLPKPVAWTKITSTPPKNGVVGTPYTKTFSAAGQVGAVQWSTPGSLPAGLSLSAKGVLSGTPNLANAYALIVNATDSIGRTDSVSYNITITGPNTPPSPSATGNVRAWGGNWADQLGDGTTVDRTAPVTVANVTVKTVAAGYASNLGIDSAGHVWTWGDGSSAAVSQVPGLSTVTAVAVGTGNKLALRSDGTVWSWGDNYYGQTGNGSISTTATPAPVQVPGLTNVVAIAAGYFHNLALRKDGTVWAWGWNNSGQLGDGTTDIKSSPIQIPGLAGVKAIAAGGYHSLALLNSGTVSAWGGDQMSPAPVPGLSGIARISAGGSHNLALTTAGQVWAWGDNGYGQLGVPGAYDSSPVAPPSLAGVTAISAGSGHSVALKADGTVYVWGLNDMGQLGNGTTINSANPAPVQASTRFSAIAAGGYHTLAVVTG